MIVFIFHGHFSVYCSRDRERFRGALESPRGPQERNITCLEGPFARKPFTVLILPPTPLQVSEKTDVNESAKTFVVQWIESAKPHYSLDYYHKGDGPTMEKIRSALDSPIEFNLKLATHLANLDDGVEFKKAVSEFAKNVIVQSNIDVLNKVKVNISVRRFVFVSDP